MTTFTDKLPTTLVFIDGDLKEGYKVDIDDEGDITIWCENSQAVWTTLADLRALVKRLERTVFWKEEVE